MDRRGASTRQEADGRRESLDYGIDGVVVKVAPLWLWPELGVVGEREPRYAIAYKFPPDLAVTKLLAIELNVGRTGSLNPYARLEPVEIGGVPSSWRRCTISRTLPGRTCASVTRSW
jgi:DNA ligase (NAD+)